MYAIIFWEDDKTVKPLLNKDGAMMLFDDLTVADAEAEKFEEETLWKARVISIEGVCE